MKKSEGKIKYAYEYEMKLRWSEDDEGYIVTVPEFKNFSAFGYTREEAVKEAEIAFDLLLRTITEEILRRLK